MTESTQTGTGADLLFEKHGGVATLTLNRPASRNALTTGMFLDIERILMEVEADEQVRVVVFTGAEGAFSAGADLKPVAKEERQRTERPAFPGDGGGDILERVNRTMLRIRGLPKPVIASLNGVAVGVACSLALAADLRIASEAARLGVVFSKIGLGPDGGASYFLRELIGSAKALELMFFGDIISAQDALQLGLVNRVVPAAELESATAEMADRLANGPTLAYGLAKQAIYQGAGQPLSAVLDLEARNQNIAGRSHDAQEGIRSFLEKRKPAFRGN